MTISTIVNWSQLVTNLLMALLLAVFGFVTNSQVKLQESFDDSAIKITNLVVDQRVAAQKMAQVQESLKVIRDATADRYTRLDAKNDRAEIYKDIKSLDARLRSVERWVDSRKDSASGR